ncbi:cadherin-like domain-containing protein [Bradyrhizobium neotropicale]|uniref:cadherin-like domain-containing protein n=1 Tax=Bradyrhizobium neotropicale TaxID=1497615 RepID=UPI001AD7A728|nr:cadherin-like domain-containing protein [Bradyrhizobium neotropicale]MBO4225994.1 tandem-95 repeat protein [Bradyrhizobium neotropicale]
MKYDDTVASSGLGSLSNAHVDLDSFSFRAGHADSFTVPDAHLLFSGNFHKSGNDLVISDELHRVVVPNYFHGDKHPTLVSPEGASLDPKVVDALTGHTVYAQAGAPPAAELVGHIAKMTGSASVVRSGVTVELHNGEAVYQSDVVQTGSDSTLGLVLKDGTTFNLNANARLMLNELTYDASSNSNSSLITLVQGAASFVAGQVARSGDMKVATPIATMGIRGTAVILDISSVDGTVKISVVDQQDNQVHAVQVFNTRGVLIGTVTSNGSILTLTPTAAFELIARESAKTLAEIAQEFATFQAVLNTYEIQKAIDPNLPQHTENNANPQTKFAHLGSSTSPNSPATEFRSALNTTINSSNIGSTKTFSVLMDTGNGTGAGGLSNQAWLDQGLPGQQNNQPTGPQPSIPFVVNPPTVTRISTTSTGDHFGPVMSADGQFVTYDPDGVIYLFDRATGVTIVISPPGGIYGSPTISSDGHSVVYQSSSGVIFLYNNDPSSAQYHTTIQIGVGTSPAVSGDGSRIAVENGGNIIVYDRQGHVLTTITPADAGAGGSLLKPAISADGHVVAFWGADPGGSSGHLYVYDRSTGVISTIADTAQGVGASAASLSADGRYVVYQSADANGHSEIYLYDLQTHQIVFHTSNPSGGSYNPVISPDGHFIIFASDAALTSNDHNSVADTYVVNLTDPAHPKIMLVSTAADGASGNAASNLGATISAGGLFIAFGSNASNLSTADGPGGDIFVVDPSSGRNAIVEQTANSGSVLTTSGKVGITGGINDVSLSVTDAAGNPTGLLHASFSADGNFVNWTFAENKSDFASLVYGDTATQQFLIKLTYNGGTTTIPITIGVHNAVPPTIPVADTPPVVHDATLAVSEGGVVVLTPANINVTDLDDSSFTFTVTNVTHGKFQVWGGEGWIDTASFTSADLAAGHVRFVHDGCEAAPTFAIQASDGELLSNVKAGSIAFTNVNDAPMLAAGTVTSGMINVAVSNGGYDHVSPEVAAKLQASGLISGLSGEGYGTLALDPGDDNSSGPITITSVFGNNGINFFGHQYKSLYINNNGNITFGSATDAYTPSVIDAGFGNPIIAVFWADVDTRGHGHVYYDLDAADGVMTITWDDVGYFDQRTNKLNSFQLVLISQGNGNFDIQYRYGDIDWTTGDASGGSDGLGGTPARAGYSAGDGKHYYELPQSGNQDALLTLPTTDGNTGIDGVDQFEVHNGEVGLTATGMINFVDPDLGDVHTATSTYTGIGTALGTLTLVKQSDIGGVGGQFVWTYTADPAAVRQALDGLPGHSKVETFNVVISDGHGGTLTQTVSVTLNEIGNYAPVVSGVVTGSVTEDGSQSTLNALANASDSDQDTLTVVNVPMQLPDGVCYNAATHSFTLDPSVAAYQHLAQGEHATVTVNYGVSDGHATTPASVSWTITGADDAPVAAPVTLASGTEDASYVIDASDLLAGVSDVDSQSLSITGLSIESGGGSLVDNHNGTWTYTPAPGYAGLVSFTYTASDGALTSSSTASLTLCEKAVTTVAVTVHSPAGYDFTTFYDDLTASHPVNGDGSSNHAFVLNDAKGIIFDMVSSAYSYNPETRSFSYVIDEIDIFGTRNPAEATPAHLLVSTHGWNMNVQAVVNPIGQDAPSDPGQSAGTGTLSDLFSAVAFNYVGSVGPDVFLASDHPDVFNGLGGPSGPNDPGSDTVDYSHASGAVSVNLLTGATSGTAEGDIFSSIENLRGTAFDDTLIGDGHNNILSGGGGNDTLFGGGGNDTFVFKQNAMGHATIGDFTPGHDKIELDYVAFDPNSQESFNAWFQDHVAAAPNGHDVQIDLDGNDHNTILLKNVALAQLHANDFILPPGSV